MNFSEFGLNTELLESMDAMGFTTPTPVQELAIPEILNGRDIIACAQTGTGKTAAFLLPTCSLLMHKVRKGNSIGALVIVPTRELAIQIDQQMMGLSYFTDLSSIPIYGGGDGADFDQQRKALTTGADVVIATPGKLLSHLNLGYVKVDDLSLLILDEADRMLDMGFYEDITRIARFLPKERQTLMFSATMPRKIRQLAKAILKENPAEVNIAVSKPAEGVEQKAFLAYDQQKLPFLQDFLQHGEWQGVLIFASTKKKVKEIAHQLKKKKLDVSEIHSDLDQNEREETLRNFKSRRVPILVATDVVSRGIDIEDLGLVINYDVPGDPEDYIHRVGRTARAAQTGQAVTLISDKDINKFKRIEDLIGYEVSKEPVPEKLGPAPFYQPRSRSGRGGKRTNDRHGGNKRHSQGKNHRNKHERRKGGNSEGPATS